MREQELSRRPLFYLSPQLNERRRMLQLLKLATSAHKLSRCALHLGEHCTVEPRCRHKTHVHNSL